jgi:hypothetical protein
MRMCYHYPCFLLTVIAFGTFHVFVFVMTSSASIGTRLSSFDDFFKIMAVYTSSGVTVKSVPFFRDYQLL